ncbi:TIGR03667 family PPOX class F420-dependent oxidoreductase [Kutzneria viridogrisea]|uniref:PPOX class probable F420-dependent enzyme n=1 Tax=Kutzneria viridogrisea TaxID=47990 RepID=A0ABR6BLJ7_9PSEU|nr:PPOX class probable F420-dependent enzyme [Kutzneria viridogrisea]
MDLPEQAARRLAEERFLWLTTITANGAPAPTPVWFVPQGADLVVYSEPNARKIANIERQPLVSAHFNADPEGHEIVVLHCRAQVERGVSVAAHTEYLAKYREGLAALGQTVEQADQLYTVRLRLTPRRVWLGPEAPAG